MSKHFTPLLSTLASMGLLLSAASFATEQPAARTYEVTQVAGCQFREWIGKTWKPLASAPFSAGEKIQGSPIPKTPKFIQVRRNNRTFAIPMNCLNTLQNEAEEAVDLNTLNTEPGPGAGASPVATSNAPQNSPAAVSKNTTHAGRPLGPSVAPMWKVFFDFAFYSRPGVSDLTFDSFHNLVLVEIVPTPDIQFGFELNPNPRYFELDYQVLPKLQLRVGKIWIPFDDMSPHNIFGGRVNVSRLAVGSAFLPDLWTDLGVGFRWAAVDNGTIGATVYGYVVNGFRDGGRDPLNPNGSYPLFSDLPTGPDNNRDKAVGGRVAVLILRKIGVGLSYYTGRWNPQSDPEAERLSIIGNDVQLRFNSTEIRAGYASMNVNLTPTESFTRAGAYVELGQRFGTRNEWKALARAGQLQLDNRAVEVTDQKIVGGTLLYDVNPMIQLSAEHSRDLTVRDGKPNYTFTALRTVFAF